MRNALASLSLLMTGIACGVSLSGTQSPGLKETPSSTAPEATAPSAPAGLMPADDDDTSLRVTPVVKAVRRSADSVVSIYIADGGRQFGGRLQAEGQGSGVIIDAHGLVITNWHVVAPAATPGSEWMVRVRLKDKRSFPAHVISSSSDDDLALLQLEMPDGDTVKPIALGSSAALMTGETLIAIGNPQGHANTVTVGVLSAEDRSITVRTPDGAVRRYSGLLQTDAAINQGNSGGALLDITGKLIGINNAMAVGSENIGFAIPVDTVKHVFEDVLLASDHLLADAWIGMHVVDGKQGPVVAKVDPSGPAARAGVREGDLLQQVDREQVRNALDYTRHVLTARPGKPVRLDLRRDGEDVQVDAVPMSHSTWELMQLTGMQVEEVTYDDDSSLARKAAEAMNLMRPFPAVVRVTQVEPDGPAADLTLRKGDVLLGLQVVDGWRVRELPFTSEKDMVELLRSFTGSSVKVFVLRGDRPPLEGPLYVRG